MPKTLSAYCVAIVPHTISVHGMSTALSVKKSPSYLSQRAEQASLSPHPRNWQSSRSNSTPRALSSSTLKRAMPAVESSMLEPASLRNLKTEPREFADITLMIITAVI